MRKIDVLREVVETSKRCNQGNLGRLPSLDALETEWLLGGMNQWIREHPSASNLETIDELERQWLSFGGN